MTTAPVALYTKIIYLVAEESGFDFRTLYCFVGLFNSLYLILYSFVNASKLMRYSTRSTEEIFSLFICVAFTKDALGDAVKNFQEYYFSPACKVDDHSPISNGNMTSILLNSSVPSQLSGDGVGPSICQREVSILFLLLMFGTLWLAVTLYNFNKT
uniref:Sodium bicarbonate transporterlike protein 11like [Strongylocentrotus purpuratus] n=3 Tax=Lepeophtheirus salmonis TaxID=72036 RepID=A0A0K2U5E2_LEPSM